jgi:hypothetical protein
MRQRVSTSILVALGAVSCVGRIEEPASPQIVPPTNQPPITPINPNKPIDPENCVELGPPITPRLRRLTFAQYDRTVSELVGMVVTPSTELGPEIDGVTPTLWAGVESAAEDVTAQLGAGVADLASCTPSGDGAACALTFITEVGERAYRRPLTQAEIDRYVALYTDRSQLTETGSFEEGVGLILEAMLMSPNFLVRVERSAEVTDGVVRLAGYEVATRLAYALWNGPPDAALLTAARDGTLNDAAGVRTQAERMLTSTEGVVRAKAMLRDSQRDFLGMVGAYSAFWTNTLRDRALFPEFYSGIDEDYREEVLRFVDEVVFNEDGGYASLLGSRTAVVNEGLAPIYGLSGTFGPTWQTVTLGEDRPGLLTRAGFVGTHGRVTRGSLIFRGAFVLKRLLCQEVGSPPAGADATPLPDPSADVNTTRERIQAMTANQPCKACHHDRINPAGWALESFDAVGKARTMDNGEAVDTTGTIKLDGVDVSYVDAASYSAAIGVSGQGRACFVQRFADFTFTNPGVQLGCNRDRIAQRLGEPGVSVKDMMVELVSTDMFRSRSTEEAP